MKDIVKIEFELTTAAASGLLLLLYRTSTQKFIALDVLDQEVRYIHLVIEMLHSLY